MKKALIGLWMGLVILCGTAQADVTFDIICRGGATDISPDGSVVVGNTDGEYETFRWTEETGRVLLGMATVPEIGVGAGTPDVSVGGVNISATILTADSLYATQGLWTQGEGWRPLMPPTLPDGGVMDYSYSSAWGLSDDGGTLVGLYWRPGQPGGSAHASAWTDSGGFVDLGSTGVGASRANDANYDGSVIVGWEEDEVGNWMPVVWVDGAKTNLATTVGVCEAGAVTPDGTRIAGQVYDEPNNTTVAAMWTWNGGEWEADTLGALPGTFPYYGNVYPNDITADGSMVVGYNAFDWTQSTGFIWTQETGMVDVEDFLTDNGVTLDPSFNIISLQGVSDDGTVMVGHGQDTYWPYTIRTFVIRIEDDSGVEDEVCDSQESAMLRVLRNPTGSPVTLMLNLPRVSSVSLAVYDVNGRLVRRLIADTLPAGEHEVKWDGRNDEGSLVACGIYLAGIEMYGRRESIKMMLMR